MGKVDQGVFSYWVLAHHFRRPLQYVGFGGRGKQVRDLLHIDDLVELLDEQLGAPERWDGFVANVGGGQGCSLSLLETTALCAEITGHRIEVGAVSETRPGDVPLYISDCRVLHRQTTWRPQHDPRTILTDIHEWLRANEGAVRSAL
jgi:CDP-paratose 2-epimerase